MWHFRSKYQKIGASMKASHKWLKAVLVLGVKNFGLTFVALKLVKLLLFDNFFLYIAKFRDLDVFLLFDFLNLNNFSDFLVYSILFSPISNLFISSLPLLLLEASLLLLFLLEADLLLLFLLRASLLDNSIVFSIKISRATILLKL